MVFYKGESAKLSQLQSPDNTWIIVRTLFIIILLLQGCHVVLSSQLLAKDSQEKRYLAAKQSKKGANVSFSIISATSTPPLPPLFSCLLRRPTVQLPG